MRELVDKVILKGNIEVLTTQESWCDPECPFFNDHVKWVDSLPIEQQVSHCNKYPYTKDDHPYYDFYLRTKGCMEDQIIPERVDGWKTNE
jgi:hypothetical protein